MVPVIATTADILTKMVAIKKDLLWKPNQKLEKSQ